MCVSAWLVCVSTCQNMPAWCSDMCWRLCSDRLLAVIIALHSALLVTARCSIKLGWAQGAPLQYRSREGLVLLLQSAGSRPDQARCTRSAGHTAWMTFLLTGLACLSFVGLCLVCGARETRMCEAIQHRSVRVNMVVKATLDTCNLPGDKELGWALGCTPSHALPCRHCPPSDACARVLHCGCGNSLLGCQLAAAGYKEVVNTDVAANVVAAMRARFPDTPGLSWCALC